MPVLSPLTSDDLPEVMRIERTPGYEGLVGAWSREEHEAQLASPDARYFGLREGEGLAGFVILQTFREPAIRLRRIAVGEVERGTGTRLLRAIVDWVFEHTTAQALTLSVAKHNDRARRVYRREGFVDELPGETHFNMVLTRARGATARNSG